MSDIRDRMLAEIRFSFGGAIEDAQAAEVLQSLLLCEVAIRDDEIASAREHFAKVKAEISRLEAERSELIRALHEALRISVSCTVEAIGGGEYDSAAYDTAIAA